MRGTSDSLGSTVSLQRRKIAYLAKFEVCNIRNLTSGKATKQTKEDTSWSSVIRSPCFPPSAPGGCFSIYSRCCPDTLGTQGRLSALGRQQYGTSHCTRTQAAGPTTPESPMPAPLSSPQGPPELLSPARGGCSPLWVRPRESPQPAQSNPHLSLPASIHPQPRHLRQAATIPLQASPVLPNLIFSFFKYLRSWGISAPGMSSSPILTGRQEGCTGSRSRPPPPRHLQPPPSGTRSRFICSLLGLG